MASSCPQCGNLVSSAATTCKQCGSELAERPPLELKGAKGDDAVKYMIIIGSLLGAVLIFWLLASGMGMTEKCPDCRGKGQVVCSNCRDGRAKCLSCKGQGRDPQTFSTCQTCNGKGEAATCPKCKDQPRKRCPTCAGSGSVPK